MKQTVQFFLTSKGSPEGMGLPSMGRFLLFAHKSAASIGQTRQAENMKKALAAWLSQAGACVPMPGAEVHREAKGKPTVLGSSFFFFFWGGVCGHPQPPRHDRCGA